MNVQSMANKTVCALVLLASPWCSAQETLTAVDIRQGVPPEAHLVVFGKNNPERAYQKQYLAEVWQTVQDEEIIDRFFAAITSQVPEDKLLEARSAWDQMQTALEPMNCAALADAKQVIYAQQMEQIFTHHLLIVELPSSDSEGFLRGFEQVLDLFEKWSDGKVSRVTRQTEVGTFVTLDLPDGVPFRPTMVRQNNVMILSSSEILARISANQLDDPDAETKFDDPRFVEALAQLPAAEDAVVFFDGRMMFEKLHGIPDFIRQQAGEDNEQAQRIGQVIDRVLDEVGILDYELTVEYTVGHQNRVAVFGKLQPNAEKSLLYRAVTQGEPFEDWTSWVPADAEAYSLNTGINLHVVYEGVMQFVREEFPESHAALDKFEAKQQEIDFHFDRDLLQAFSGEIVSVTLPVEGANGKTTQRGVTALRCHDAERIQELLHRAIELLTALPPVQAQQLKLVDCEDLEGFQELQAAFFGIFQVQPVIGFHEGWMIISTSPAAAAKVVATRTGEAPAISQSESFQKFDLEATGPVQAISYTDVNAAVHQAADTIEQIGAIAPMFIGMAAAQGNPEDLKPVQEIIGLLPSVAKVVRKFDFMEEQLTVTRAGSQADTYRRDSVWLIRAPEESVE